MLANLYLHSEAFRYNGTDSERDVVGKIKLLLNDIVDIVYRYGDENVFKTSKELVSNCNVYKKEGLMDFIENHLDIEEKTIFYTILANISEDYDLSSDELKELCLYKVDEKEVNSLLVMNSPINERSDYENNSYMSFDEYKVVYSNDSWITLRRQILGNHPGDADNYINTSVNFYR